MKEKYNEKLYVLCLIVFYIASYFTPYISQDQTLRFLIIGVGFYILIRLREIWRLNAKYLYVGVSPLILLCLININDYIFLLILLLLGLLFFVCSMFDSWQRTTLALVISLSFAIIIYPNFKALKYSYKKNDKYSNIEFFSSKRTYLIRDVENYRDKLVVNLFWNETCGECLQEIEELTQREELSKKIIINAIYLPTSKKSIADNYLHKFSNEQKERVAFYTNTMTYKKFLEVYDIRGLPFSIVVKNEKFIYSGALFHNSFVFIGNPAYM